LFAGQSFLSASDVYGSPGAIVDHKVSKVLAAIIEAKAETSMDSSKAWAQVAAQGAALCVLTFVSHDIDKSYYPIF
jgi:hypothetical protein